MEGTRSLKMLVLVILSSVGLIHAIGQSLSEKTLAGRVEVNQTCLDLLHNMNASLMDRCEFFKCFEERFPCGKNYWIMNWGYKYCRRYANPTFIANFTRTGQELLDSVNKCLPNKFEKFYRRKNVRCWRLFKEAFVEQTKCYTEIKAKFCKGFDENKLQFVRVLDYGDMMQSESIEMIKKAASGCVPKIDLLNIF